MPLPPAPRPALRELAERMGILSEYVGLSGTTVPTGDETRVALLAAMGIDGSSEERARAALDALCTREREALVAPVQVVSDLQASGAGLALRLTEALRAQPLTWSLELREENGVVHEASGTLRDPDDHVVLPLPAVPALGYHTLRLRICGTAEEREVEQSLIVAPSCCVTPAERLGERRAFGIIANLYTLRSARDWGVGDCTDLRALAEWSAEVGAAFVGVNPLHALRNRGSAISPYSPVSRLYRNVLYLDVEAVPELTESEEARALLSRRATRDELDALRASERVEYERVMALKRPMLEALYRTFVRLHRESGDARAQAYARYVDLQGESLTTFATFLALDDHFGAGAAPAAGWHEWPAPYRDPRSPEVLAFRESHREAVDFHRWLQFELDRQLEGAARAGVDAGLAIGLYQDLAIGTARDGSDTWAFPELFVRGASIGAPPDPLAPQGQNWALPPLDPRALREDRYRYWTLLLRSALAHAGALRIDHVMGLFRQFWIPDGMPGTMGAYVRFPADDLLGILALESTRHRAIVVGEDLGTVPPEVPPALQRWGILGSRVLYFERDRDGDFASAETFAPLSLTTANTHDLPPLAGFWSGRDIELRRERGLIASDEAAQAAHAARERDRQALLRRLAADRVIPSAHVPTAGDDGAALRGAVHAFLCRTPAALVGIALDDLVGETEPVNIPGATSDVYPSWTRRLHVPLEALRDAPGVAAALRCDRADDV